MEGDAASQRLLALAHGFEFAKRCAAAPNLEQLHLLLTNDIAALVEHDRAFLLSHLADRSELVAVGNQPTVPEKTRFREEAEALGRHLRASPAGMLVPRNADAASLAERGVPAEAAEGIRSYVAFSGCDHLFVVPLGAGAGAMYHLVLEFFGGRAPSETRLLVLLSGTPLIAAALAQKWILHRQPETRALLDPEAGRRERASAARWRRWAAATAVIVLLVLGFVVPVALQVGGEAEVAPRARPMAFSQIAGLVERVLVREGERVEAGQLLATLDPREIDHRVKSTQRQVEILTGEIAFLERAAASGEPSKLAEKAITDLKRKQAEAELKFYEWQKGFLEIRAPVAGTVVTREIESLAGRKLQAGEPLCELLGAGDLAIDVLVPEDRIARVMPGQPLEVFLDADPRVGHRLTVERVAPRAEAIPRLGNVFRVQATFPGAPERLAPGMRGVGKVTVGTGTLGGAFLDRLLVTWRKLWLAFG